MCVCVCVSIGEGRTMDIFKSLRPRDYDDFFACSFILVE